jgi:hypothetical protein
MSKEHYIRTLPTCQIGFWKLEHRGCPVCGPDGPCTSYPYGEMPPREPLWRRLLGLPPRFVIARTEPE